MERSTHLFTGVLVFIGFSLVLEAVNKTHGFPWIYGLIIVSIGSILPDILEPATSWRHRGIFHSMRVLLIILPLFCIVSLITLIVSFFSPSNLFYYLACFFLGYAFHLLVDSLTPRGLPK